MFGSTKEFEDMDRENAEEWKETSGNEFSSPGENHIWDHEAVTMPQFQQHPHRRNCSCLTSLDNVASHLKRAALQELLQRL